MGKSTISMAIFHSFLLNYQRVYHVSGDIFHDTLDMVGLYTPKNHISKIPCLHMPRFHSLRVHGAGIFIYNGIIWKMTLGVNVGKYSSTMDPLGLDHHFKFFTWCGMSSSHHFSCLNPPMFCKHQHTDYQIISY